MIKTENPQRDRTRLSKSIVLALRELMRQSEPSPISQDLAAYISLALLTIFNGIESSVAAWEKRGYWVKADRFRREWEWTKTLGEEIGCAVLKDDWAAVAVCSVKIAQKFSKITIAQKHRLGTPWVGAFDELMKRSKS